MKPANEAALDAFIKLIAEKGFADVALRDVAEAAGLGLAELYRVYPDKVALVAAFLAKIDAEVLAGTPSRTDPEETARDRLFDAMMRRYDAQKPYREALAAVRRAGARDPMLALARRRRSASMAASGSASVRAKAWVVRCGKMGCWRFTTPCRAFTTRTGPPICRRPWQPWTAA